MDPRYLRSRGRLHAAIFELAAAGPVSKVTVAEVCRRAGVTRDTFYRHASSPLDLLATALNRDLAQVAVRTLDPAGGIDSTGGFRGAERALLDHVADHAAVYRNAMEPTLAPPMRTGLERLLRESLLTHLRRHPDILPARIDPADELGMLVLASYAASGTVGAIEAWLSDDPLDVDRGVTLILSAAPTFWFASTSEDPTLI